MHTLGRALVACGSINYQNLVRWTSSVTIDDRDQKHNGYDHCYNDKIYHIIYNLTIDNLQFND